MPPEQEPDSQNQGEQQKSPEQELGNMVNAAVTAHMKRLEKQFALKLDESIKGLTDKIAAIPQPSPDTEKKSKEKDPETLAMAKKLEEMDRALKGEQELRLAAEKKARDDRAYADLRAGLEGKVRPELLDIVAKNLFYVEKVVDFDESGNALFKTKRTAYGQEEEIQLPMKDGVGEYLKSNGAKPFLPAPPSAGAPPLPKRAAGAPAGAIDFSKPATSDADKIARARHRAQLAESRGVGTQ